ncbi:hypothetical protein BDQ17DRAFT_1441501 [Cyathus striatus]|nr:hypothetical protein BDQ17DRAFT_1441501 [Cyathus striatus]
MMDEGNTQADDEPEEDEERDVSDVFGPSEAPQQSLEWGLEGIGNALDDNFSDQLYRSSPPPTDAFMTPPKPSSSITSTPLSRATPSTDSHTTLKVIPQKRKSGGVYDTLGEITAGQQKARMEQLECYDYNKMKRQCAHLNAKAERDREWAEHEWEQRQVEAAEQAEKRAHELALLDKQIELECYLISPLPIAYVAPVCLP